MVMRTVCASIVPETMTSRALMRLRLPGPDRAASHATGRVIARRRRASASATATDDHALKDVHQLLRDVRVERQAALLERAEEQRGEDEPERAAAPEERDRDAAEACARAEAFLEVALVAEHRAEARGAGDGARDDERLLEAASDRDLLRRHRRARSAR